ncbi:hypothetical protein KJ733_06350 [Patescibacteria group bacterium]|nr:hypothetical protein [Patescibacteria group bacterium]MBU1952505.1 hypothetical protein [Patescibacteria group bacterium]MBU2229455.1 hypothetical protein [Patescibacteria group bacterium]
MNKILEKVPPIGTTLEITLPTDSGDLLFDAVIINRWLLNPGNSTTIGVAIMLVSGVFPVKFEPVLTYHITVDAWTMDVKESGRSRRQTIGVAY